MTVACALYAVPPFHGGGRREIVRCPGVDEPYARRVGPLVVRTVGCRHLLQDLS
jgi:hypothetical protein